MKPKCPICSKRQISDGACQNCGYEPPETDVEQRAARLDAAAATGNVEHYTAVVQAMIDEDEREA